MALDYYGFIDYHVLIGFYNYKRLWHFMYRNICNIISVKCGPTQCTGLRIATNESLLLFDCTPNNANDCHLLFIRLDINKNVVIAQSHVLEANYLFQ